MNQKSDIEEVVMGCASIIQTIYNPPPNHGIPLLVCDSLVG